MDFGFDFGLGFDSSLGLDSGFDVVGVDADGDEVSDSGVDAGAVLVWRK